MTLWLRTRANKLKSESPPRLELERLFHASSDESDRKSQATTLKPALANCSLLREMNQTFVRDCRRMKEIIVVAAKDKVERAAPRAENKSKSCLLLGTFLGIETKRRKSVLLSSF